MSDIGASLAPVDGTMLPQPSFGEVMQGLGLLGNSGQGPLQVTSQMGQHANWDKFLSEARRSENVEDNRGRVKDWHEILRNLDPIDWLIDSGSTILQK